ncbi:MAG TPA: 4-hydroxythreonine-4-phosphate dehydrogenase PdxA [Desulfobulbus sp.]|nr:4-hydroxythreonine-4-phosphate dehydrogenase PdxA [Desulfobulbus sp.]
MGCPVGIGPEIITKFFHDTVSAAPYSSSMPMVVIGNTAVLLKTAEELGISLDVQPWHPGDPVKPDVVSVFDTDDHPLNDLSWGKPTLATARAMIGYIEDCVRLICRGALAGMVTCPISKISLQRAGSPFPGHTEMLASLTGISRYRMMMAGNRLKVVLATIHEPLARIPGLLNTADIQDCIAMTVDSLVHDFGRQNPRVAVAGLNPHCGENGMFGSEEETCITPAITGYDGPGEISGPWPPDTVFFRAAAGDYDAVVAMYHDQGLIPFKLLHFKDGVNVTLGLPVVRTSVDHGTAYDIAGRGLADPESLKAAVQMAADICSRRAGESR